jgi:alkanesulfonate monooxygenase SsuD/methylene tetrahydromethanopterin reductase-like flavin-dependent oxidoreductase (luciferase family)
MNSIPESLGSFKEALAIYEAAVGRLRNTEEAFKDASAKLEDSRSQPALVLEERVKLKAAVDLLLDDLKRYQKELQVAAVDANRAAGEVRNLIHCAFGERIHARMKEIATQIRADYNVAALPFSPETFANQHRSLNAFKSAQHRLNFILREPDDFLDFEKKALETLRELDEPG